MSPLPAQLESRQLQPLLGDDSGERDPAPPGHLPSLSHRHEHERDPRESPPRRGRETEARQGLSLAVPAIPHRWEGASRGGGRERDSSVWRQQLSKFPRTIPGLPVLFFPPSPPCSFPIGTAAPPLLTQQSHLLQRFCLCPCPNPGWAPKPGGPWGAGRARCTPSPALQSLRFNFRDTS